MVKFLLDVIFANSIISLYLAIAYIIVYSLRIQTHSLLVIGSTVLIYISGIGFLISIVRYLITKYRKKKADST